MWMSKKCNHYTLALLIGILFLAIPSYAASPYYVSKGGSDAHACSSVNDDAHAKLTVAAGLACLASGDTLYIHVGTYTEGLVYNSWPDGIDDSNHTIVRAYAGETVTINGAEGNGFVAAISGQYKTLEGPGLILDAVNATNAVAVYLWGTAPVKANHIILQDMEIKNGSGGTSALITAGGDGTDVHHITMSRVHIHGSHGGTPTSHGLYMHMTDSTIEDCEINDIAGYGIQVYSNVVAALSNNTIQRCKIHDVAQDGTSYGGLYLGGTNSDNIRVINTALWNNGGPGSCAQENGTLNTLFLNVTCAGFAAGIGVSGFIREGTSGFDLGSIVKNTIGWNNGPLNTIFGSAFTNDHTICGSGCTGSSDPLFVNEAAGNLALQTGSPAIAAALNLSGTYGFTDDLNGVVRTVPWDLGAYAYNAIGTTCSYTICALFDSYTPGDDLTGLAGGTNFTAAWVYESGGAITIQTAPSLGQGGLALSSSSATANTRYHRLFGSTSSFHTTFQIRTTLSSTSSDSLVNFRNSGSDSGAFIGFVGTNLVASDYMMSDHVVVAGYSSDTWYKIEIAQGTADGGSCTTSQYRVKVAGGSYSFCLGLELAVTGIDELRLLDDETSAHTFWVDGIGFSNATIAKVPIMDSLRRRRQ